MFKPSKHEEPPEQDDEQLCGAAGPAVFYDVHDE
jgi:hypothetical protein